ncbi:MAG TPA: hypothetical protein VFB29_14435 [Pseudolabrys sp.]|nr:hypothetical protein [Pseudolabrys sp.]
MIRYFPILLIIFATSSVHAEQGFIEQLLESLKNANATTTNQPTGETAASTAGESQPLALQPTEATRPRYKKRYNGSRRHRQVTPSREPEARAESPSVPSEQNAAQPSAEAPAIPRELLNNSAPVEKVLPAADENNVLPPPADWPNSAPAPVAPWPVESSPLENAQGGPLREVQPGPESEAENDAPPVVTEASGEAGPQFLLDPERIVLAGFSAIWLVLGLGMFVCRRRLARALSVMRYGRRREAPEMPPDPERALTFILRNAASDSAPLGQADDTRRRAIPIG